MIAFGPANSSASPCRVRPASDVPVNCGFKVQRILLCLSVPIRTLTLMPLLNGVRHGELGVGAGIVYDSEATAEWSECRLKARFLTGLVNGFEIFETMFATRLAGCRHLERHLARLQASCDYFGHPFEPDRVRAALRRCSLRPVARRRPNARPDMRT